MADSHEHEVPNLTTPQRLSDYLIGIFPMVASRKGVKKGIKKGYFLVNDLPGVSGQWLQGGERIKLVLPTTPAPEKLPVIPLPVHYEDEHLAVVEKPAGLLVSGNKWMTLTNALPAHLTISTERDGLSAPQPAHRLDYPTSGLLLIGKTASTLTRLGAYFADQKIKKTYLAVVIGNLPPSGTIDQEIEGKAAQSDFLRLTRVASPRFGYLNLVQLTPATGRRHQLRIHMASQGNPILGDHTYGTEGLILKGKGLYLHAYRLVFDHPATAVEMDIQSALPKKFVKLFPDLEIGIEKS